MIPESTWVEALPLEQIPIALAKVASWQSALAARLIGEQMALHNTGAEALIDAKEMAGLLKCHESWVRSAARRGKIPFVAVGRYMRFRPGDVQAAMASRNA